MFPTSHEHGAIGRGPLARASRATSPSPCRAGRRPARRCLLALSPLAPGRACAFRRARCSAAFCASESLAISVSRVCSSSSTPATWATARRGAVGISPREVARVGRQLGLEPADLAAQLLADLDRLALLAEVGEVRRGGAGGLPPDVAGDARAGHRDDRQLARAEAGLAGAAQRLGGDLLQLGGRRRRRRRRRCPGPGG